MDTQIHITNIRLIYTLTHIYTYGMYIIVGVFQNTYDRKLEKERKMGK